MYILLYHILFLIRTDQILVRVTLPKVLNMFQGAQLTWLLQVVTTSRLFLAATDESIPLWMSAFSTISVSVGHVGILSLSNPS